MSAASHALLAHPLLLEVRSLVAVATLLTHRHAVPVSILRAVAAQVCDAVLGCQALRMAPAELAGWLVPGDNA